MVLRSSAIAVKVSPMDICLAPIGWVSMAEPPKENSPALILTGNNIRKVTAMDNLSGRNFFKINKIDFSLKSV
jgi:hypothetical protein